MDLSERSCYTIQGLKVGWPGSVHCLDDVSVAFFNNSVDRGYGVFAAGWNDADRLVGWMIGAQRRESGARAPDRLPEQRARRAGRRHRTLHPQ
jgi:hypothetical protein